MDSFYPRWGGGSVDWSKAPNFHLWMSRLFCDLIHVWLRLSTNRIVRKIIRLIGRLLCSYWTEWQHRKQFYKCCCCCCCYHYYYYYHFAVKSAVNSQLMPWNTGGESGGCVPPNAVGMQIKRLWVMKKTVVVQHALVLSPFAVEREHKEAI